VVSPCASPPRIVGAKAIASAETNMQSSLDDTQSLLHAKD
jgi:hypothetical protein